MTKFDIAKRLAAKIPEMTQLKGIKAVSIVFKEMSQALKRGETIKIKGFYNMSTRVKQQRAARNPKTGEPAIITKRRVVRAKASHLLIKRMNPDL